MNESGFTTQQAQEGDIVLVDGKLYYVAKAYWGGGSTGHDPWPDAWQLDLSPLDRNGDIDDEADYWNICQRGACYNHNRETLQVVGRIEKTVTVTYSPMLGPRSPEDNDGPEERKKLGGMRPHIFVKKKALRYKVKK